MGTFADLFESGADASSWYDEASDAEIRSTAAALGYPEDEDITVLRDAIGDELTTAFPDQADT
jgi:hypothetical protein